MLGISAKKWLDLNGHMQVVQVLLCLLYQGHGVAMMPWGVLSFCGRLASGHFLSTSRTNSLPPPCMLSHLHQRWAQLRWCHRHTWRWCWLVGLVYSHMCAGQTAGGWECSPVRIQCWVTVGEEIKAAEMLKVAESFWECKMSSTGDAGAAGPHSVRQWQRLVI